jgi:hypothetical protein
MLLNWVSGQWLNFITEDALSRPDLPCIQPEMRRIALMMALMFFERYLE